MTITHNVGRALEQLREFRAKIPLAQERLVHPARWHHPLCSQAALKLRELAQPDEVELVDAFVNTVRTWLERSTLNVSMNDPRTLGLPAGKHADKGNADAVFAFRDLVEQWVRAGLSDDPEVAKQGKDITEQDANKSPRQIANLIAWILTAQHEPDSVADHARTALLNPKRGHGVMEFIRNQGYDLAAPPASAAVYLTDQDQLRQRPEQGEFLTYPGAGKLTRAQAGQWLAEVLLTWREFVRGALPYKFLQELHSVKLKQAEFE